MSELDDLLEQVCKVDGITRIGQNSQVLRVVATQDLVDIPQYVLVWAAKNERGLLRRLLGSETGDPPTREVNMPESEGGSVTSGETNPAGGYRVEPGPNAAARTRDQCINELDGPSALPKNMLTN